MNMLARLMSSALLVAVTAGAAAAHGAGDGKGQRGHGGHGGPDMMQMMRGHGMTGSQQGMPGPGAMGGFMGMMEGNRPMMGDMPMMDGMYGGLGMRLDEDGDGVITPEEVRGGLQGLRTEFDADGNGTLSIDEFETLHSALIREMMVDRFQYLDADGDGQVTEEEMQAPAEMMERMQTRRDRMMERSGYRPGEMMPDGNQPTPGQRRMMDNGRPGMQGN